MRGSFVRRHAQRSAPAGLSTTPRGSRSGVTVGQSRGFGDPIAGDERLCGVLDPAGAVGVQAPTVASVDGSGEREDPFEVSPRRFVEALALRQETVVHGGRDDVEISRVTVLETGSSAIDVDVGVKRSIVWSGPLQEPV